MRVIKHPLAVRTARTDRRYLLARFVRMHGKNGSETLQHGKATSTSGWLWDHAIDWRTRRTEKRSPVDVPMTDVDDTRAPAVCLKARYFGKDIENLANQHGEKATICPHPVNPTAVSSHAPFSALRFFSIASLSIRHNIIYLSKWWQYNRIRWAWTFLSPNMRGEDDTWVFVIWNFSKVF